uniref:CABIT domain-containing protein n=1 Tax=Anabas testudineus TaxID=64144 RepID=A0A7N6AX72_ANATE
TFPVSGIALPLQQLIASLDNACLPKILQVCSGVYFQGSIYEISGSEVCFSTGDLIKVIGIELLSVSCEDIRNNEKFELPIGHTGWSVRVRSAAMFKGNRKPQLKCIFLSLTMESFMSVRVRNASR